MKQLLRQHETVSVSHEEECSFLKQRLCCCRKLSLLPSHSTFGRAHSLLGIDSKRQRCLFPGKLIFMTGADSEPLIADWLAHHARTRAAHRACLDLDTSRGFSYAELFGRVTRLAGAFKKNHGVQFGQRIMVLARNSTDVFETLFAAWRIGAVFMPVNWRLSPIELSEIITDSDPSLIVVDEEFVPMLANGIRSLLVRRPGDAGSDYERQIAQAVPETGFAAVGLDTVNTLLYTSGTTGRPKGVIGTWRMTTVMLLQSGTSAPIGPDSVTLTAAPQFHTAGLNAFAISLFHIGGTVAVMANWDPATCLRHLSDPALSVTHTLGVPTQYLVMARHPAFATARFPSLKVAAVGGAPPTEDLMSTWAATGHPLMPGYGMTEVFGVTQISAEVALRNPGAVGRPAIYTSIRVADENDNPVPAGTVGEIQLQSGGVTPGYWRQPEATAAAFVDGWFRTGDLGRFDEDGLLYLVDRMKDMFISGGENVYPVEVENLIASFAEVGMVAVIGVPDATWGEVGMAVVVVRPGASISAKELLVRCRGQIAAYKVPKVINFVDALPLSAQGKVLKNQLREEYVR